MASRTLAKKVLIVSSRVPPRVGGTPHQLQMLFGDVSSESFAVYTSRESSNAASTHEKLPGTYYYFPTALHTLSYGLTVMRTEKIEVIYAPTDGGTSFLLGLMLSLFSKKPLVLHFLDIYAGNNFSFLKSLWASLLERAAIARASKIIICNPAIDAEYRRRYGNQSKFVQIDNSDSSDRFDALRTSYAPKAPYTILFTGSIYWAQEESLLAMCEAVKQSTLPVEFTIYSPAKPARLVERFKDSPAIRFLVGDPALMPETQAKADILFVPLAWPKESAIVTLTALPGKVPEYLLAGRPLLIQAPPDSYLAEYAKKDGFAAVVTSKDPAALVQEIEHILTDTSYTQLLLTNARKTFGAHHDVRKNAPRVAEVIESV